jgi:hypothetical protein
MLNAIMLNISLLKVMLNVLHVECYYAEQRYVVRNYAECTLGENRSAECRGTFSSSKI